MFDTIFLHIGTEKTGTTSIQGILSENSSELAKQGYFYSKKMGNREHIDLVCAFADPKKIFTRRRYLKLDTTQKVKNHTKKSRRAIESELETASKQFKFAIISSERLFVQISEPEERDALLDFLGKYTNSIKIICYLRRQVDFATSSISTKIRNGSSNIATNILPNVSLDDLSGRSYWYDHVLSFWNERIPKEDMEIRIFSRETLMEGDIVPDFFSCVGLKKLSKFKKAQILNPTLSREAQLYFSKLNYYAEKFDLNLNRKAKREINKVLVNKFTGSPLLPARSQAVEFQQQFNDENALICKKWFPEKDSLFSEDYDKFPETPPNFELEPEQEYLINVRIIRALTRM